MLYFWIFAKPQPYFYDRSNDTEEANRIFCNKFIYSQYTLIVISFHRNRNERRNRYHFINWYRVVQMLFHYISILNLVTRRRDSDLMNDTNDRHDLTMNICATAKYCKQKSIARLQRTVYPTVICVSLSFTCSKRTTFAWSQHNVFGWRGFPVLQARWPLFHCQNFCSFSEKAVFFSNVYTRISSLFVSFIKNNNIKNVRKERKKTFHVYLVLIYSGFQLNICKRRQWIEVSIWRGHASR